MTPTIFTHNGRFTVLSTKTGEHRTFQVKTQKDDADFAPGERLLGLLSGTDNEADYVNFAFVDGRHIRVWTKKRTPAYLALVKMLENLPAHEAAGKVQVLAATKCRVCNRPLTCPASVLSGIGPICSGRADAARAAEAAMYPAAAPGSAPVLVIAAEMTEDERMWGATA